MDNLAADFIININNPIEAEFELGETEHFDCSFELFASGTVWGSIDGDITNQTDLQNALNLKADKTDLDADVEIINQTINENYNDLSGQIGALDTTVTNNYTDLNNKITVNHNEITSLSQTLQSYGDIVTYDAADFATAAQGVLANTALQPGDNISELVNNAGYITGINSTDVTNALGYTPYNASNPAGYITSADLPTLEDLTTQAQMNAINSGATSVNIAQIASNTQAISTETLNRQNADNGLQSQIDAIVASSDVFDIVGTYAELQAYDISTVPPNDIIKVLVDSTHNNAATYYRCVETGGVKSWSYIGSEGAYYTKSEADGRFVPLERTINGKALSSNITLDASDVGALPSSTVIPTVNNGTLTIQVNGTSVGTFTANQSGNTTANIIVPDSATWGNITGDIADQTDLQDALDDKQDKLTAGTDLEIVEGSILPNTYTQLTSITSTGTQWINSGIKLTNNFKSIIVGRLTGTPATNFRTILGANNNNLSTGKQNVLLGWGNSANGFYAEPCTMPSYTYSSYPWDTNTHTFTTTVTPTVTTLNIDGVVDTINSAPSITGVNLAIFARLAQNDTVGSQVNFELNSIELYQSGSLVFKGVPAKRNSDDEVGLYDTVSGSFSPNSGTGDFTAGSEVPTSTVINFTNETGYITGINSTDVINALGYTPVNPSSLATVATSGDYDDLTNKPPIPTVGDGTITITQGGVTKGSFTTNQSGNATIALDAGGGGGTSYNAGLGIDITNDTISIDTSVVAQLTDIPSLTGYATETWVTSQGYLTSSALTGYINNTATGTDSLTILGGATANDYAINIGIGSSTTYNNGVAIGYNATTNGGVAIGYGSNDGADGGVAIGREADARDGEVAIGTYSGANGLGAITIGYQSGANGDYAICIGEQSGATNDHAIQIGYGINNTANTLQIESYTLLNTSTGLIPDARISSNIARTSQIPTVPTNISAFTNDSGYITSASLSGYLENTATGTDSLTVLGTGSTYNNAINIGVGSSVSGIQSVAVGKNSVAGKLAVALGSNAEAANGSIQLGYGTNSNTNTFSVGFHSGGNYELLDNSGIIPDARLSSNIARTANVANTTLSNVSSIDSNSAVKTALDTKLNTADVWYDSTTSTLNIGVAQV